MEPIVKVRNVYHSFGKGQQKFEVLKGITLSIEPNSLVALKGRSGSGKTTLLNLMGALDEPESGEIHFAGKLLNDFSKKEKEKLRRTSIGFIFQSFGLIPLMTVEENIEFGLRISEIPSLEWKKRIKDTIELVGLTKRANHLPFQLSGGEQQRCAIARAIAPGPALILADEPTAELDSSMAFQVIEIFQELTRNKQTTIVMTTHDNSLLEVIDDVYTLESGGITYEQKKIFLEK
ncbi:ABC transporter ATP-binding protein [Neobacillus cucumis]|uniref:Macrolide ABC transporter ATP-binding protein n=1 Tax=Neobacillus cucumis TaxID=1740721 RepID=A0A2N5H6C8_9BACI|nr:ABC transporter ATP-binding protein [Neobacillus cucumis]PLS01075.1 macrolide ABC transporter ATP-binding protein [Neobacillus cucumis]